MKKGKTTSWYNLTQRQADEVKKLKASLEKKDAEFAKEHRIRTDMEKEMTGALKTAQLKQEEVNNLLAEKKEIEEAVEPIMELLIPEGAESGNHSLVERLRQVPELVGEFCKATLKDCTNRILALFKAHNPTAELDVKYMSVGLTDEQYEALVAETEPLAEDVVNSLQ